jgi:hypothetical protein
MLTENAEGAHGGFEGVAQCRKGVEGLADGLTEGRGVRARAFG